MYSGQPVILWDLKNRRELARLVTTDYYGKTPVWSLDGQKVTIAFDSQPFTGSPDVSHDELLVMNRDGQIQQQTQFAASFQYLQIYDSYTFSPNGKLIAFWMVAKPSPFEDGRLAVLDTSDGQVTNYCIKGDPLISDATPEYALHPVWSPDSTKLLMLSRDVTNKQEYNVVVVDPVHGYAATIARNVEPAGWMTKNP